MSSRHKLEVASEPYEKRLAHLVHLAVGPIADHLDQLEDPCWILQREKIHREGEKKQEL